MAIRIGSTTVVDMNTGEVVSHKEGTGILLPPVPGLCQTCAVDHDPEHPHNADSLYYQMAFNATNGRYPTWVDAMAHCSIEIKEFWLAELREAGVDLPSTSQFEK